MTPVKGKYLSSGETKDDPMRLVRTGLAYSISSAGDDADRAAFQRATVVVSGSAHEAAAPVDHAAAARIADERLSMPGTIVIDGQHFHECRASH